ncbi:MAG: PrgI family protein [Lachnospiraceae bacterium]
MEIELSEDLKYYKESVVLGLTAKQLIFSILALGAGTAVVLLLYTKIGITISCYVATPFVVPLALTGFYNYHGLTFWQFASKMVHFSFCNRPLVYGSTESIEELQEVSMEIAKETQKAEQEKKRELKKEKKEGDVTVVKKKAIRMVLIILGFIVAGGVAAVWYKYSR